MQCRSTMHNMCCAVLQWAVSKRDVLYLGCKTTYSVATNVTVYTSINKTLRDSAYLLCSYCSGNTDGTKDNLPPENYDAYVDYLTEGVSVYWHKWNITFRTLEPFNEPSASYWHAGNKQEGCHFEPAAQVIILQVHVAQCHHMSQRCCNARHQSTAACHAQCMYGKTVTFHKVESFCICLFCICSQHLWSRSGNSRGHAAAAGRMHRSCCMAHTV